MLTRRFKEDALKSLEHMSAKDFVKVFERIGSQKALEKADSNIEYIVQQDLERYLWKYR